MKTFKIAALLAAVLLIFPLAACHKEEAEAETEAPTAVATSSAYTLDVPDTEYSFTYNDAKGKPVYEILYTLPAFDDADAVGVKFNNYFRDLFQTAKSNGATAQANFSDLSKPYRETATYTVTYLDADYVCFDITVQLDVGQGAEVLSHELSTFSRITGMQMSLDTFATSEQSFNFLSSSVITVMQKEYISMLPDGATVFGALNHKAFCLTENGFRIYFPAGSLTVADRGPIITDFKSADFKGYFDNLPNMK